MTNGSDRHHGPGEKKKKAGAGAPKPRDVQAMKRKKMVPATLTPEKKG